MENDTMNTEREIKESIALSTAAITWFTHLPRAGKIVVLLIFTVVVRVIGGMAESTITTVPAVHEMAVKMGLSKGSKLDTVVSNTNSELTLIHQIQADQVSTKLALKDFGDNLSEHIEDFQDFKHDMRRVLRRNNISHESTGHVNLDAVRLTDTIASNRDLAAKGHSTQ